jgi:hypothetical protein
MQLLGLIATIHVLQGASSSSFLDVLDHRKSHAQQSVIAEDSSSRHFANGLIAKSTPRRIYIDLGANWGNTLRLFEDIGTKRSEMPWEIYAFEASPFMQPYLEKFTAWLNGQGAKPPVTVPPSGSSGHLSALAPRYGCPTCESQGCDAMRSCMWRVFKEPLSQLQPDQSLQSRTLIQSRLDSAKAASPSRNHFVAVPAAAGASSGTLNLGMMTAEQMIRGGAVSNVNKGMKEAGKAVGTTMMTVPMVDFPKWLTQSFTPEDYIIAKMDIEGAEFSILNTLLDGPSGCLMDVLALECHAWIGDCAAITKKLQQHSCISVVPTTSWDHHSGPDVYFAKDPRLA